MYKKYFDLHTLVFLGLLTAIQIILSRFLSISAWNIKIGFSFVPVAVAAILLGPVQAGTVAALGDFVGALLFPIGAYFPGFTFTAFLTGVTFGVILRKKQTLARIAGSVAVNQLILSLLLNTLWISILYSSSYSTLLYTRALQTCILIPVQFGVIRLFSKVLGRLGKRVMA